MKTINELDEYSREKFFKKARQWRLENHSKILELIKGCNGESCPPAGPTVFYPEKWVGRNWLWFSEELTKKLKYIKWS